MRGIDKYRSRIINLLVSIENSPFEDFSTRAGGILDDLSNEGFHRCPEWDFLLICPDDDEFDACICKEWSHLRRKGDRDGR